jgi:hypothetical protein
MPFQKGHVKHGGKRKGSKHKITNDLRALLDEMGCNPIEGLARIAIDPKVKPELRAMCNAQIAKYIHPQLKAIEVSGKGGGPIKHEHNGDARQLLADRIARISSRGATASNTELSDAGTVLGASVRLEGERETEPAGADT